MPHIRKGNRIPNATLYEDQPDNQINILDLVGNKKAIIFGVPGAYVPGCSRVHLRGFIEKYEDPVFIISSDFLNRLNLSGVILSTLMIVFL